MPGSTSAVLAGLEATTSGWDVNIAARVGESAKAGEVLVSDPARAALEDARFSFGRRRRLRESGAPRDLSVRAVTAVGD